jgi:hypothetical protein
MMKLLEAFASWPTLVLVIVVFGFAPGFCLRLIVLAYPRRDPRRAELIAGLYDVPRIQRPLWVAQQLEGALFEGYLSRLGSMRVRPRTGHARSVHFLLAIAVWLLPLSQRARYLEEFHAELLDVARGRWLWHALSLLRGVVVTRLCRGLKRATDAAVRRVKG